MSTLDYANPALSPVPEPATLSLLALPAILFARRQRKI